MPRILANKPRHFLPLSRCASGYGAVYKITTAGLAGGLHRPYKGLLPAAPVRVHEAAANRTYFPPAAKAAIFSWAFLPAHP